MLRPEAESGRIIGVGGTRFALEPHNCFACGSLNSHGLNLTLHLGDDHCWTELRLTDSFEGWQGIAHGGIVCTILDEVMAWSLVQHDVWGVTARMAVEFRRPVRIGQAIRGEGRLVERRRRVLEAAGRVVDVETGEALATASGTYVAASETRKRELKERYGFRPLQPAEATPVTGPRRGAPMTAAMIERPTSATTVRAVAFVAAHRADAEAIGRSLADVVSDPDAFAAALDAGLRSLADPDYLEGQQRVAPGIGAVYGVRWPLIAAVKRGFREATRRERTSNWLFVADRLLGDEFLEPRWFAFGLLERLVADDAERTWQLLRRAASDAADWITVDSLAHPVAKGILLEPYRWSELEQLVFSPSRWERRLVGSTIATAPHVDRKRGRGPEVVEHGLALVGQLIGDAEPDVQKALAWALRTLAQIDRRTVAEWCRREAERAAQAADGHRAWVIRDSLSKLEPDDAEAIRATLTGIRRSAGAPPTSEAAAIAGRFGPLPDPRHRPTPPLPPTTDAQAIGVSQGRIR